MDTGVNERDSTDWGKFLSCTPSNPHETNFTTPTILVKTILPSNIVDSFRVSVDGHMYTVSASEIVGQQIFPSYGHRPYHDHNLSIDSDSEDNRSIPHNTDLENYNDTLETDPFSPIGSAHSHSYIDAGHNAQIGGDRNHAQEIAKIEH